MALRDYAGNAIPSTLVSGITNVALGFDIPPADATSWPTGGANGKFVVTLDRGLPAEERILVTSQSGGSCTIASLADRGLDGTTAVAHSAGATAEHTYAAFEAEEANAHINSTALDHHTQYMLATGTRHDLAARHTFAGLGWTPGVPTIIAPDDAATEGAGTAPARSDHRHGIVAATPVAIGTTLTEGVSTSFARADHGHELGAGSIDTASFFAAGVVNQAALANGLFVPIGGGCLWFDATVPTNWFIANGQAISRTTYATLFALWGTDFGVGNGSTTFNIPDLRQRLPLGVAASGTGNVLGGTGGTIDHVHNLTTDTAHARIEGNSSGSTAPHWRRKDPVTAWTSDIQSAGGSNATADSTSRTRGVELGGDTAIANPPFMAVHFIIRAL
jgi:microcystin-dependent protein